MPTDVLMNALLVRERDYREAVDRLQEASALDLAPGAPEGTDVRALREAVELVGCLRRLLTGRTRAEVHRAFGAPGDFGYDTPIGDALSQLYRGPSF